MPTHDEIKAAGGNDVGDWGETDLRGMYDGPLEIAGEMVDVSKLPAFGDVDEGEPSPPASAMGDLESTGGAGNYGEQREEKELSSDGAGRASRDRGARRASGSRHAGRERARRRSGPARRGGGDPPG